MLSGRRMAMCVLVAFVVISSSWAHAQPPRDESSPSEPPPDPKLTAAKELFREADVLRVAGDCLHALPLYARSRALVPSVPNTLNAAICLTDTERTDEAFELYAQLLLDQDITADERASVEREMRRLQGELGLLDVSGEPGAQLVIGGRRRAELPIDGPIYVRAGAQEVRVVKQGFLPFVRVLDVRKGQTTAIRADLVRLTSSGRMVIAEPAGAELIVDGAPIGSLPFDGLFAPGAHVLQVVLDDRGSALQSITIVAGQTQRLSPVLAPLGAEVSVTTEPAHASLAIGGVSVGGARWRGRLPVGQTEIEASAEGYVTTKRTVSVSLGNEPSRIDLKLAIDRAHPRWEQPAEVEEGHVWIELLGGVSLSPGMNGGAAASCDAAATCAPGSPTVGFVLGARAGYELPFRLSFELTGGYLGLGEDVSRTFADGFRDASGALIGVTYSLHDQLRARGGFVTGGLGYRAPLGSLLSLRGHLAAGLLFLNARDVVRGEAVSSGQTAPIGVVGSGEAKLGVGLIITPEVDVDVHVDSWIFGLGLMLAVAPLDGPSGDLGDVAIQGGCDPAASPTAIGCAPTESLVGGEPLHGPMVMVVPNLHAGYRF